ncbi:hypothetical protein D6783_00425 [Candidatus Woesearchaeota archaeon]|nr:MAG: hypothetical protein D6783_00425 [Candidatus Woesearchaeota archaeon]
MVFSIAGTYLGFQTQTSSSFTYGGVKFTPKDGVFKANIKGKDYEFYVPPQLVERYVLPDGFLDTLKEAGVVAIAFSPDEENAPFIDTVRFDLARELPVTGFGVTEESADYDLGLLGCEDASPAFPVIVLQVANVTRFSGDASCVVFEANNTGFLELRDSLLYQFLGVVPDASS